MEKVQALPGGQFTLRSCSQAKDGQFQAAFVVTEHEWHGDIELQRGNGRLCATAEEAVDAGMQAALAWLDRFGSAHT